MEYLWNKNFSSNPFRSNFSFHSSKLLAPHNRRSNLWGRWLGIRRSSLPSSRSKSCYSRSLLKRYCARNTSTRPSMLSWFSKLSRCRRLARTRGSSWMRGWGTWRGRWMPCSVTISTNRWVSRALTRGCKIWTTTSTTSSSTTASYSTQWIHFRLHFQLRNLNWVSNLRKPIQCTRKRRSNLRNSINLSWMIWFLTIRVNFKLWQPL